MKLVNDIVAQTVAIISKAIPVSQRIPDDEFINGNRFARIFGLDRQGDKENTVYATHPWVYAATNTIARNIAGVPFVFQTSGGEAKNRHAYVDLFERPNRWMGFGQFIEALVSWLTLHGEVFIVLRRTSENQVPREMWPDDPSAWEEVIDKQTKRLVGWEKVMDDGSRVPFRLFEVIHLKFWNPLDPFRGLSPISAARQGITQDLLANQFNNSFYRNSGAPGGVVEIDETLTDRQFTRLAQQYEDKHGGPGNAHKLLLLEGGAKWKQTSFSQKDMEFLDQKKWNRDETLAVFNVPKGEVGIIAEGANLAVVKVQSREFWLKNLIPKMKLIEWAFWSQLFSRISGGRVWAEFDHSGIEALWDEFHEKVLSGRTLWEMGYPVNQINKRLNLGMPENSWQNVGHIPVNITPIAVDTNGTPIPPDNRPPSKDPLSGPGTGPDTTPNTGTRIELPPPAGVAQSDVKVLHLENTRNLNALEIKTIQTYFYKQRVRQLKAFGHSRANLLNLEDEQERLTELLENKGDISDLLRMNTELHNSLQTIVALHFDDLDEIISKTKGLYNTINTSLPDILEHFAVPSTKELEKDVTSVTPAPAEV
jgi:HK97 family phage portal protein